MSKTGRKGRRGAFPSSVRASISFPPDLYRLLEELAISKKISVAWIVRDAAEKYVAIQQSLKGEFQK